MAKNDVTITSSWKPVRYASFLLAEIAICNFRSLDKPPQERHLSPLNNMQGITECAGLEHQCLVVLIPVLTTMLYDAMG